MEPQVYAPGAGHQPTTGSLPGRGEIRSSWADALAQLDLNGRHRGADPVFTGLRGTGKTVLLHQLGRDSRDRGFETLFMQSTKTQGIWSELAVKLDLAAQSRPESFWQRSLAALRRISGVQVMGSGLTFDASENDPQPLGRSGAYMAHILAELGRELRAAHDGRGGLILAVDELQTAPATDIEMLGAALHQLNTEHTDARVGFIAAGLPGIHDTFTGPDKNNPLITHPERLFEIWAIPPALDHQAITLALAEPARTADGTWTAAAIDRVADLSRGYPAHLQVIAAETWKAAPTPAIDVPEVDAALPAAAAKIESQYLAPRWDRLSDRQQEYLTALAVAGGTATARQMQTILDRDVKQLSPVRDALLSRGEIHTPQSRTVALSMPLMETYDQAAYPATHDNSDISDRLMPLQTMRNNAESWAAVQTASISSPASATATLNALTSAAPPEIQEREHREPEHHLDPNAF